MGRLFFLHVAMQQRGYSRIAKAAMTSGMLPSPTRNYSAVVQQQRHGNSTVRSGSDRGDRLE